MLKIKGFVLASRLAIGNAIVTRAGPAVTVTKIENGKEATVYNFEVEDDHTYFVGVHDGGLWVHNYPPEPEPDIITEGAPQRNHAEQAKQWRQWLKNMIYLKKMQGS